jgi:hypothetical protein
MCVNPDIESSLMPGITSGARHVIDVQYCLRAGRCGLIRRGGAVCFVLSQ